MQMNDATTKVDVELNTNAEKGGIVEVSNTYAYRRCKMARAQIKLDEQGCY